MFRLIVICAVLVSSSAFAHWDSAYFRNAGDGFTLKKNWMGDIGDDVMLSELALPGTHQSGTYKKNMESVMTQVLSFDQQLEYGIRVFDIRVRHTGDAFALHQGPVFLNVMFGDFLNSVDNFLARNPSETVLFRLSEERAADSNNSRTMRATLEQYLSLHKARYLETDNFAIRLGQARGKFIMLNDLSGAYGLGLAYCLLYIQDNSTLKTRWDLYNRKWRSVKTHLSKAVSGNSDTFYINYLSGAGGASPYFVASGHSSPGTSAPRLATGLTTPGSSKSYPDFPRVSCLNGICTIAFEGMNVLTRDRIVSYNMVMSAFRSLISSGSSDVKTMRDAGVRRTVGIIMSDFPGESLITSIINNNLFLRKTGIKSKTDVPINIAVSNKKMGDDILLDIKNKRPDVYGPLQKYIVAKKQ